MSVSKGCIIMADVKLSRPASGQQLVIPSAPDARLILDFPADQVSIDRPEGSSSLFFQFEDGASIELQNFYGAYNKEALPEFEVDGQLIAGTDFFEAFGPDLVPAAGPAATAERGARYSEYSNMGLAEGVWHLNELDYRLAFDGPQADDEWAYGVLDNVAPALSTGGAPITLGLTETGWDGKSTLAPGPVRATGSFTVRDPDGDSLTATVSIGGKTVAVSLDGPTTVESDYGTLVITPSGRGSNVTFDFEYTLKEEPYSKTDQLAQGEQVTDGIVISVNDGMGHTVTQPVNVVITGSNDAPDITGVVSDLGGADGHTVKDDGVFGRQGDQKTGTIGKDENTAITAPGTEDGQMRLAVSGKILAQDPDSDAELTFGFVDKNGDPLAPGAELGTLPDGTTPVTVTSVSQSGDTLTVETDYGTLTLVTRGVDAGSYTFTLNKDADATNRLAENEDVSLTLRPTVTDNHGATDGNAGATRPDADGTSTAVSDLVITIRGSNDLPTVKSNTWTETAPGVITEDDPAAITGIITAVDVDADEGATLRYGFNHDGVMVEKLYVVPAGEAGGKLGYTLETEAPTDGNYYGTLTITGSGASAEYGFELNNGADCTQALDDSSSKSGGTDWSALEVAIPVVVMDAAGGHVQKDIHLTIKGVNDAPEFVATSNSHSVKEAGVYSGDFAPGSNDLHTSENAATQAGGTDQGSHEHVATGKVEATDVDGHGASDTLTYGLDGAAADSTLYAYLDGGEVKYSTDGPSADSNAAYLGKLVMNADGNYTFTLNDAPGSPANALPEYAAGNPDSYLKLAFTPTVSDGTTTVSSSTPIEITIKGSNDLPSFVKNDDLAKNGDDGVVVWRKLSGADAGEVLEKTTVLNSGTYYADGRLQATDPDTGDVLTYGFASGGKLVTTLYVVPKGDGYEFVTATTAPAEKYGTLTITDTNKITFTLDNKADCVQELDSGDRLIINGIPLVVMDDKGAWNTAQTSVVINGANDLPTFVMPTDPSSNTHGVKESGVYSDAFAPGSKVLHYSENGDTNEGGTGLDQHLTVVEGKVQATDVDKHDGDRLSYGLDLKGRQFGATDGEGDATIFVTAEYKDGAWTPAYSTDPATANADGYLGKLVMGKDGNYTFTLKDEGIANTIAEGDSIDLVFTPAVHDGTIYNANGTDPKSPASDIPTIKVTVHGSNDAPIIKSFDKGISVTEATFVDEGSPTASGTVTGSDEDKGDTLSYHLTLGGDAATLDGAALHDTLYVVSDGAGGVKLSADSVKGETYGTLIMSPGGKYTFTLDNSSPVVEKMTTDEAKSLDFSVAVVDSKGAYAHESVTLTINGANDAPHALSQRGVGTVKDDGVYSNDSISTTTLNSNELTSVVEIEDNDIAPDPNNFKQSVSGSVKAEDYEGDKLSYSLDDSDSFPVSGVPDGDDASDYTAITNDYGTLYLKNDGTYTFVLDVTSEKTNALGEGESHVITFPVRVSDGNSSTSFDNAITITVKGTNDAPVLGEPQWTKDSEITQDLDSSATTRISGTVTATDADSGDQAGLKFYFVAGEPTTDAATGVTTTPIATTLYVLPTMDGDGKVTGYTLTSDKPASGVDYLGELNMSSSNGEGSYAFTLNNASPTVQGMGETDTHDISFKIAVRDPQGAYNTQKGDVTFTIRGGDDPTFINTGDLHQDHKLIEAGVMPKSTVTDAEAREYEDSSEGVPTATGRIHATDVDTKDQKELDGAPNTEGTKLRYFIEVGSKSHDLNKMMADAEAAAEAKGENKADASFTINTQFGELLITRNTKDGGFDYKYSVDNDNAVVQKMNLGGRVDDGFTVLVKNTVTGDPVSEAPVKITITGANDRPTIDVDSLKGGMAEIDENTDGKTLVGRVEVADVDQEADKGFTFSLVKEKNDLTAEQIAELKKDGNLEDEKLFNLGSDSPVLQGQYGRLTIDQATGEYRYERTEDLTSLARGSSVTDVFYVRVKDADGAYSEIKPIEITIKGADNTGYLTNDTLTITEDGVAGNVQGILNWKGNAEKLGANVKEPGGSMSGKLGWHDVDTNEDASGNPLTNLADGSKPDSYSEDYTYATILKYKDADGKSHDVEGTPRGNGFDYAIGGYGTLHVEKDGSYTFAPGGNGAYDELAKGQSVVVDLGVTKENTAAGENIDGSLHITINGTNDAPVVEITQNSFTVEKYTDAFTGKVGSAAFTSVTTGSAAVDYLVTNDALLKKYVQQEAAELVDKLARDGNAIIKGLIDSVGKQNVANLFVDLANGANNALNQLGKLDDIFKMTGRADDIAAFLKGELAGRTVLVDSDETAVWSGSGGTPVVRGTLDSSHLVTDVDNGATLRFFALEEGKDGTPTGNLTQSIQGQYGTLVIHTDGSYQYILDFNGKAYKDFAAKHPIGGDASETFKIYVRDEHNAVAEKPIELVINVDAPSSGSGGSGGGQNTKLLIKDVGAKLIEDDTTIVRGHVLKSGEPDSEHPRYDGGLCLTGKYTTDAAGSTKTVSGSNTNSIITEYGTITLLPDGTYTYTLNNDSKAVQELTADSTIRQQFTVKNGEGHTSTITVTIEGANDAPYVVSQDDTVRLKQVETGGWEFTDPTGSFKVADVDKGETQALKPSGSNVTAEGDKWTVVGDKGGIFTVTKGADGQFTYTYKAPEGGESVNYRGIVEDTANLILANGSGDKDKVTVDLKASLDYANDKPSFTTDDKGNILLEKGSEHEVIEDGGTKMVARGEVKATDPDVDSSGRKDADSLTYTIKGSTTGMLDYIDEETGEKLGTLIMGKNGSYEFHLNTSSETVQALGKDQIKNIAFEIQVDDGHGGTATAKLPITITGTNDAPVISLHNVDASGAAGSGALRDLTHGDFDKDYTVGGELKFKDVDANDKVKLSFGGKVGEDDLRGDDDADPARLDVWAVKGGSGWKQCAPGTEGAVKMGHMEMDSEGGSASGSTGYRFVGDKDALALINKGEKLDVMVSINADDGKGGEASADFTVSITGTNSIPTITTEPVAANITDNGTTYSASGTIVAVDADGDTLTYSIEEKDGTVLVADTDGNYVLDYGTLTLGNDGKYEFKLNGAGKEKMLALGLNSDGTPQTESIGTFTVVVKDAVGARAEQELTLSLTGRNDAPVAAAVAAVGLTLDSSLIPDADWTTASQVFELAKDADADDTLAYTFTGTGAAIEAGADIKGDFGSLTFSHDDEGHLTYEYRLDTGHDNLVRLAEAHANGQNLKESFDYTVSDNHGGHDSSRIDISIDVSTGPGMDGGTENQLIFGNGDSNHLHGGSGNDILSGGAGDDYLFGGAGDDYLFGGSGNDFLDGGEGNNHLYGGDGNDVLVFHKGDAIDGGAGTDILLVSDKEGEGLSIDELFTQTSGIEVVVTGADVNSLTNMGSLAERGITFNADNQVVLDHAKGWHVDTDASTDVHDVWANNDGLVVTVRHEDESDAAKNAMVTLTA